MNDAQKRLIGEALADLVAGARGPRLRLGLMVSGTELGVDEFFLGAQQAMAADPRLQVVAVGPRPVGSVPETLDWIETGPSEQEMASAMEQALQNGALAGAVALHYPFPIGVTTIGRLVTPARGRPLFLASTTGTAASQRAEAMLRNALYGIAVAKSLGVRAPTLGLLNLEGAPQVQRALLRLAENGYPLHWGCSVRADGGSLLRGNDLLTGSADICVCDTLTGNVLMKVFSAGLSGGLYETSGWGYGPSVGENWPYVVSIISRASGAPVISGALAYTAAAVRGHLPQQVAEELALARKAGFDALLGSLSSVPVPSEVVSPPPAGPVDCEIHGIDVLELENAVHLLWRSGLYAEAAMGCTGPVVKLAHADEEQARQHLRQAGYL